jgi:hypothetical protein
MINGLKASDNKAQEEAKKLKKRLTDVELKLKVTTSKRT